MGIPFAKDRGDDTRDVDNLFLVAKLLIPRWKERGEVSLSCSFLFLLCLRPASLRQRVDKLTVDKFVHRPPRRFRPLQLFKTPVVPKFAHHGCSV